MKKFLLVGIEGVYNYGCEAIVRGTERILRSRWPDAAVVYASPRPGDDRRRLAGCDVQVVPRPRPSRYAPVNIARKVAEMSGSSWRPPMAPPEMLDGYDAVLSIGGDIYTLAADGGFETSLPRVGTAAAKRGVPYVLWGASVGPFRQNPRAERYFREHLSTIHLLTIREQGSVQYLASLGVVSNVVSCADPAFVLETTGQARPARSHTTIGVNLSPLSLKYCGVAPEAEIARQGAMLEKVVRSFDAKVLLLPHVRSPAEADDDVRYLANVRRAVDPALRGRVELVEEDAGFFGVKSRIVECDAVVAARMHCSINALAAGVPTILLSYSAKAGGVAEYVYGDRKWVLPLNEFSSDAAIAMLAALLERSGDVRGRLAERLPQIRADAYRAVEALAAVLS